MPSWKRKNNRAFNAIERGRRLDLETVKFLGQDFIVAATRGNKKNRRYDLIGAQGTQLAGIFIGNVSHDALRKYRDDETASAGFVNS